MGSVDEDGDKYQVVFFGDGSYQYLGEKQIKKYQYDSGKYARKVSK